MSVSPVKKQQINTAILLSNHTVAFNQNPAQNGNSLSCCSITFNETLARKSFFIMNLHSVTSVLNNKPKQLPIKYFEFSNETCLNHSRFATFTTLCVKLFQLLQTC